jgi:hypothetical protein
MKKLLIGVVLGLCSAGAVTFTLHEREAQAASDSKAMQLSRMAMSKDTYKELVKQTMQGISASLQAQGQGLPADKLKQLELAVAEALPYEELLAFNAQIYGSRFSDKELDDIIAFYKTPTGAKLIKLLPDIAGEVAKKVGGLIPQRLPAALKKHGFK